MNITGFNITEICQNNHTLLTAEEFDILLNGYCDLLPSLTEKPSLIEPSSSPSTPGYVVYYSMLVFGGIILNLWVMITIFSRSRLRTVPNAFMVSLSMADFLMATVAIPLRMMERLDKNNNYVITSMLYPCIGVASIFSLCCVTLDRYVYIRHPLNYDKYMNKSRAIGIVAGLWIFSILQASVIFFVHNNRYDEAIYNDVRVVYCFGIPAIFISVAYTKLFMIARLHARDIVTTSATIRHGRPLSQKKKFKTLKVVALIVGTFVLCWFPFLVAVSYELHAKDKSSQKFYLFMGILECLTCSTCVLNPLIYGLLSRDLRVSMRYAAACKRQTIEEIEYM